VFKRLKKFRLNFNDDLIILNIKLNMFKKNGSNQNVTNESVREYIYIYTSAIVLSKVCSVATSLKSFYFILFSSLKISIVMNTWWFI